MSKSKNLKVGDLVYKSGGYRPGDGRFWYGIILEFRTRSRVLVLSSDGGELEKWQTKFVEKVQ